MEANVESKAGSSKKNRKWLLVLLLALSMMVAAAIFFARRNKEEDSDDRTLGYENGAVVVSDQDELQRLVDGMVEMTKDGMVSLEYKNVASSSDGKNFSCYIANSVKNKYDMYLGIYSDMTLEEELFLTQLLRPGTGIEEFEAARTLEPGSYDAVLVFTQVKEDHETIQAQASVSYTLTVAE